MPKKDKSNAKAALLANSSSKDQPQQGKQFLSAVRNKATKFTGKLWLGSRRKGYVAVDGAQSDVMQCATVPVISKAFTAAGAIKSGKAATSEKANKKAKEIANKIAKIAKIATEGSDEEREGLREVIDSSNHYGTCKTM